MDEDDIKLLKQIEAGGSITTLSASSKTYRKLVTSILFQFADSQLAGASGFADSINIGPTLQDRVELSGAVHEKLVTARRVYDLLEELGINLDRYFSSHSWESRAGRFAYLGFKRASADKRLNALMYPLQSWADVAVFMFLMATMTCLQLKDFRQSSFGPWAELSAEILDCEKGHAELGKKWLAEISPDARQHAFAQVAVDYWYDHVADSFGPHDSEGNKLHRQFRLKSVRNDKALLAWRQEVEVTCSSLNLSVPEVDKVHATARNRS